MSATRSICLFCSARENLPASARDIATEFGTACAARGYRLVYGGSGRGLMGMAARAAVAAGGEVLGIMPRHLIRREAAEDIGILKIVDTLAERKQCMAEAADAFVALPGGIGTLDELIEMLTLNDLGLQDKPVILCASDGFWRPFAALLESLRAYGTLRPETERRLRFTASVGEAMDALAEHFRLPADGAAKGGVRHGV